MSAWMGKPWLAILHLPVKNMALTCQSLEGKRKMEPVIWLSRMKGAAATILKEYSEALCVQLTVTPTLIVSIRWNIACFNNIPPIGNIVGTMTEMCTICEYSQKCYAAFI